jgi:hypothetical protein
MISSSHGSPQCRVRRAGPLKESENFGPYSYRELRPWKHIRAVPLANATSAEPFMIRLTAVLLTGGAGLLRMAFATRLIEDNCLVVFHNGHSALKPLPA